jgi:hypothetical protein
VLTIHAVGAIAWTWLVIAIPAAALVRTLPAR